MAILSAGDVAEYFLAQLSEDCGDTISNMKLQKLVYYAQGFSLAALGKPIFSERIKVWAHGPVVPSVWVTYTKHGAGAIPAPDGVSFGKFTQEQRSLLDEVYRVYGQFSAWKLRNLTHAEPPWRDAPKNGVITHKALREYFKTQLRQ